VTSTSPEHRIERFLEVENDSTHLVEVIFTG
jgi:hypothetical protein